MQLVLPIVIFVQDTILGCYAKFDSVMRPYFPIKTKGCKIFGFFLTFIGFNHLPQNNEIANKIDRLPLLSILSKSFF